MVNDSNGQSATPESLSLNNADSSLPPSPFPDALPRPLHESSLPPGGHRSAERSLSRWWWLTAACIVLALGLFVWSAWPRGQQIVIRFREGHGLRMESRLMHRGIECGYVAHLQLDPTAQYVDVVVQLNASAKSLAVAGSQFWIERPIASLQRVRGLETIVSGRYIAVQPGGRDGAEQFFFQGLEHPLVGQPSSNALEIILEARDRHGLQVDTPVVYRGLEVGRITRVGLSADSRWIQIHAMIEPDYRQLIRDNSRFWNRTGVRVDLGLAGLDVDVDSLSSLATGGVEFATPDPPGDTISTGKRFELADQADEAWLAWSPRLLHGANLMEGLDRVPVPIRLVMRWQEKTFGFRHTESRRGWVLPLSDNSSLGPRDLFHPPESALPGTVLWEMAGRQLSDQEIVLLEIDELPPSNLSPSANKYLTRAVIKGFDPQLPQWSLARTGTIANGGEEGSTIDHAHQIVFWIASDLPGDWIPVEEHQYSRLDETTLHLEATVGVTEDMHGAPVLEARSGMVVGILEVRGRDAVVRPLAHELIKATQ